MLMERNIGQKLGHSMQQLQRRVDKSGAQLDGFVQNGLVVLNAKCSYRLGKGEEEMLIMLQKYGVAAQDTKEAKN